MRRCHHAHDDFEERKLDISNSSKALWPAMSTIPHETIGICSWASTADKAKSPNKYFTSDAASRHGR